jgi:uncharacterized membrane protein
LHIIGILGLFISDGLEVTAVYRMRGAKTTAQVHEWMAVNRALETILPASAVLILVSGLFMTLTVWGLDHAWITLTLSLLVVLGILGPVINGPRMKAIQQAVRTAPDGPVSGTLQKCILDCSASIRAHPQLHEPGGRCSDGAKAGLDWFKRGNHRSFCGEPYCGTTVAR